VFVWSVGPRRPGARERERERETEHILPAPVNPSAPRRI
jgi:hypothetical protein